MTWYVFQAVFLSQAQSLMTIVWLDKRTTVTGVGKTLVSTHSLKFSNLQAGDCEGKAEDLQGKYFNPCSFKQYVVNLGFLWKSWICHHLRFHKTTWGLVSLIPSGDSWNLRLAPHTDLCKGLHAIKLLREVEPLIAEHTDFHERLVHLMMNWR